jgi:hypothetical protein
MKIRRRPFVRTLVVGSVLAVTGCNPEMGGLDSDGTSPDGDTNTGEMPPDIQEPEIYTNPWFDVDAGDGWDIDVPEVEPDVDYTEIYVSENPAWDYNDGDGDQDAEVAPEVTAPDADAETSAADADAETDSSDADVLLPPGNPAPDA